MAVTAVAVLLGCAAAAWSVAGVLDQYRQDFDAFADQGAVVVTEGSFRGPLRHIHIDLGGPYRLTAGWSPFQYVPAPGAVVTYTALPPSGGVCLVGLQ